MKSPEWWDSGLQLRFTPATLIISLFWFSLAKEVLSREPQPGDCEPRHCGNDVKISYPFWISEGLQPQPSYCGYPGFNISCEGGVPVVSDGLESQFIIHKIFYYNKSIIVSSAEFSRSHCPYPRHNLSLPGTFLEVRSVNCELFFYLNCTQRLPGLTVIECAEDGEGRFSMVATRPVPANVSVSRLQCEAVIVSPFVPSGAITESVGSYGTFLRGGFLLEWRRASGNCSRCETTGGRCGYNETSDEFMCMCGDRVHLVDCEGRTRYITEFSKKRKIIIGVCAGVAGFLLASVVSFLLYRRNKKMKARSGSSTLLFRTASSEPFSERYLEMCSGTHHPTLLFKYEELHEATNGFSTDNELGDGGFGIVYKGKLRDGRIVAVKRLYENNYKRVEQFLNEVAIHDRLRHPNLVSLYGCTSRHSRVLLLVYEFVPNGTVTDHLHGDRASEGSLTWPIRLSIAVETASALAYLHAAEPQIIHRDVKTNNILLDNYFHVKIADFGLSRLFPLDATHVSTAPQGTPGYVDPEYHHCYQLTDKSDVYSFGVVLVELISSKPAVDITRHRHEINLADMAINMIQNGALAELADPALGFETDPEVRRMIKIVAELAFRCLQGEKEMRPSMEDVQGVLQGIQRSRDRADMTGDMDHGTADDMSLLKNNVPVSPDSVMDKWTSRSTTPNASG